MRNSFLYEIQKLKNIIRYLFVWIIVVQIISLIFFTIIGKFETVDTDSILHNIKGIITLSSTVTVTVITIYMMTIINKFLIIRYIGNFRERTYSYPKGREKMFVNKVYAIICRYIAVFMPLSIVINIIYYLICYISAIMKTSISLFNDFLSIFNITILSILISIVILIISIIFGIKYQSTNISLITSIIFVAIIGNLVANTYYFNSLFLLVINLCLVGISFILINYCKNIIKIDDLLK